MLKLSNMKYTIEQLNLLIHNCDVYHLSSDIKQKYINMLEKLKKKNNVSRHKLNTISVR